jgi:tetratricopeptide (TPR) repeat protein
MSTVPARDTDSNASAAVAAAFEAALSEPASGLGSGFVDPAPGPVPEWTPIGELPERLAGPGPLGDARFCLTGDQAVIGLRGARFTDGERAKRPGTRQSVSIVLNGMEAIDVSYEYDGRADWTCVSFALPAEIVGEIHAIEIEEDGRLLLSRLVASQPGDEWNAKVWFVSPRGVLMGGVTGANGGVALAVHVNAQRDWTLTGEPAAADRPRPFEFNVAPHCGDGAIAKVSVADPVSGREVDRSPVGVFVSGGRHFLLANVRIADSMCRATLLSWQGGKRQQLFLARHDGPEPEIVCPVNGEDEPAFRFDGGHNSFAIPVDLLRSEDVLILGEDRATIGKLPAWLRILEFAHGCDPVVAALAGETEPPAPQTERVMTTWAREAESVAAWTIAAERWERCIASFGVKPEWLTMKAQSLMHASRIDDAEQEYRRLVTLYPDLPNGQGGLGWIAQERGDWPAALDAWSACLALRPDQPRAQWLSGKALALRQLGRSAEATAVFEENDLTPADLRRSRIEAAIEDARRKGIVRAERTRLRADILGAFDDRDVPSSIERARLMRLIGEHAEANRELLELAGRVNTLEDAERILRATTGMERGGRDHIIGRLLQRVRAFLAQGTNVAHAMVLEVRLLLALERFDEFCSRFDAVRRMLASEDRRGPLARIRQVLAKSRGEIFAELKIFGIGLSRTGTRSLSEALQILGFEAAHWTNPLTHQILGVSDAALFDACTDICISQDFEKLSFQYPNARFILTGRSVDDWAVSIARHYHFWHQGGDPGALRDALGALPVERAAIEFGLYLGADNFADAYRQFETRVHRVFAGQPGRLLELNIFAGQGWRELCTFLGTPEPAVPFPHLNKSH